MFYLISSVDVKKRIQLSELIKVMVGKLREGDGDTLLWAVY